MVRVVCIIQARRQSQRLPDKILMPLNQYPILQHVIERCKRIDGVEEIICAGIDDPYEQPVADLAQQCGVRSYQGSAKDVLDRFLSALGSKKADYILRITADCPLIDPEIAQVLINLVAQNPAPYASLSGWPHGLDMELISADELKRAHALAAKPEDREHVTLWTRTAIRNNRVVLMPETDVNLRYKYRWSVDYKEDYQLLQSVFSTLDITPVSWPSWQQVKQFIDHGSEAEAINHQFIDVWTQKYKHTRSNSGGHSAAPSSPKTSPMRFKVSLDGTWSVRQLAVNEKAFTS